MPVRDDRYAIRGFTRTFASLVSSYAREGMLFLFLEINTVHCVPRILKIISLCRSTFVVRFSRTPEEPTASIRVRLNETNECLSRNL